MSRFPSWYPRLVSACLLLVVCGLGCTNESPQDPAKKGSPGSLASDASARAPNPLRESTISEHVPDSAPAAANAPEPLGNCRAQGIGDEEAFALQVCAKVSDLGFRAELVHSYGAGGVDVFIAESDAELLVQNRAELERMTTVLTEWAKANYDGFNAVEVTIVGETKIARGRKLGSRAATIELFPSGR
jgi:hypothetical protein